MIRKKNAFTLVELLVTLLIIGVLLIFAIPMYDNYIQKTKGYQGLSALMSYKHSVSTCFVKLGSFLPCDEGKNSIPVGFNISSRNNEKINGLESVFVNDGKIDVLFEAKNKNNLNINIIFTPYVNNNGSNIIWYAQCSDNANDVFDFCE